MKKVSLLAASVALALVGCGGSDGGSDTNTGTPSAGGIVITGFDGYFKNAVVFLDSDSLAGTKGQLDETDTVFGLTDIDGKIKLPKGTDLSTGTIALQTLKPGDMTGKFSDQQLAQRLADAESKFALEYSDTYTTDMDLPGQPMEHSVVFRSQQTGDNVVISPITDLVALQAPVVLRTDVTPEQKVCDSLFGENVVTGEECTTKLYSDFTKSDPVLHKTAQILTDTKAKNTNYTAETALKATVVAVAAVEALSPDDLKDPTVRTDVSITDSGTVDTPPAFTDAKPLLTAAKFNEVQNAFDDLNIKTTKEVAGSKGTLLGSINISNLFTMHNGKTVEIDKSKVSVGYALDNKNQSFYGRINDKNEFELYQTADQSITSVGKVNVIFTTANSDNNTTANFSFDVQAEASAVKPTLDKEEIENLQSSISGLKLVVGQSSNLTLSADGFFDLPESETIKAIELSSNTNSIGLSVELTNTEDSYTFSISGRPTSTAKAGEYFIQLRATADNGLSSDVVKLDLPAIVEAIEINDHEVKLLQDKINILDLTVGKPLSITNIDIAPLFTSNLEAIDGYFAGGNGSNTDGQTTIAGVRVSEVDEPNGLFKIEGTPTSATKGGYFYVAAGINSDAEDGTAIHSEYVKIKLPDVKPADETLPPVEPELGFTEAHFNTGKAWKMGSFARNDGEIGHAMLLNNDQNLQFCWGSNKNATEQYSSIISYGPYTTLTQLDNLPSYVNYQDKDCWDVTLKADGTLSDSESTYEMLYQNKTADGNFQIIVKIDGDELFWMDSTNAAFAQSLPVSDKVADGNVEFDMTVESDTVAQEDTKLFYAAGKFKYANATYEYTSIMPEGFYTPGELEVDTTGEHEMLILKETGEQSDFKTRYRYVNHNFGDFYVGIKWSKDNYGTSAPEFGLYSYSQEAMEKVVSKLPLLQD
ncbi:hypothetical protein [Aliivibrio finisterrensis]|uniref:Acid phosphatase n=1 Tax=Aliivibrio finisterrensis TaxID=511998 RepID=A0A6N6RRA6_9GAMM|nr:hypothetical protein [Aliivibrio finisterrensis]KAB2823971.1 hypothetical protein F8B77_13205 [Aliivibrio finisterrensis]